jgi:predicted lipid carrier protein YhbT
MFQVGYGPILLKFIASSCINTTMPAQLHNNIVWKVFGFLHKQAIADRDRLKSEIEERFGSETASEIQFYVDVALGRLQAYALPNPKIIAMREFYELMAAEMTVQDVAGRIEAAAVFLDG